MSRQFSIADFRNGDRVAFELVFSSYYSSLCYFARRMLSSDLVVEDVTQEVFLRLWQRHRNFNSPHSIKAYLYIVTRNACINISRKLETRRRQEINYNNDMYAVVEQHGGKSTGCDEQLRNAIRTLPPQCRKVILLSYFNGFPNREIAQQLSLSVSTVKNQKVRGISLLRKRLRA